MGSSVVATVSTERCGVRGAAVHGEPVLSHLLSLCVDLSTELFGG